jgi:hypothetical protein
MALVYFLMHALDMGLVFMGFYGCRRQLVFGANCDKVLFVVCALVASAYFAAVLALGALPPARHLPKRGYVLAHGLVVSGLVFLLFLMRVFG